MPRLEIWVHDHRTNDYQPSGPIIQIWPNSPGDLPGESYAGWRAHYGAWIKYRKSGNPPDMIGFFAYRYYLWDPSWFPLPVQGVDQHIDRATDGKWCRTPGDAFERYRIFLSTWDGAAIKDQLSRCDLLQAAPYNIALNTVDDFIRHCGSQNDGQAMDDVMKKYGFYQCAPKKIYQFLFITHWPIFDRMMREMGPLRQELHGRCTGLDSPNGAYRNRVMDYVMERIYPCWLIKSGINFQEVLKLHRH